MPSLEMRLDENGYIYLVGMNDKRHYLLVDVPNCPVYGKIKLGSEEEGKCEHT